MTEKPTESEDDDDEEKGKDTPWYMVALWIIVVLFLIVVVILIVMRREDDDDDGDDGADDDGNDGDDTPDDDNASQAVLQESEPQEATPTDAEANETIPLTVEPLIQTSAIRTEGKKSYVNLSVLNDYFEDGEEVTLQSLKEKHLLGARIQRVKVIGSSGLTKRLIVRAHAYSAQAKVTIEALGGETHVEL